VCIGMCVCVYVFWYVRKHACTYIRICICVCIYVCLCVLSMYMCVHKCVCVLYMYIYICLCVCMYIYFRYLAYFFITLNKADLSCRNTLVAGFSRDICLALGHDKRHSRCLHIYQYSVVAAAAMVVTAVCVR
jgi:hypothetical protein